MAIPVTVTTVAQRDVPLFREYVGELVPAQQVTLRARISGILLAQHALDGARVKEGELLFSIDASDATEQREAARAQLASAQAQLANARADVARYTPLLAEEAIARQVYDNAVAAAEAAQGAVDAQAARLRQAELALGYAEVVSPLNGRMGAARVAVGDLISAGSTALAEVAVDDPLWVYFSPSENELLAFERRQRERGAAPRMPAEATLLLSDGSVYPLPGQVNFADRALDSQTGTYRLRVEFANPEGRLLPGQFARVRLQTDLLEDALLVPARAVIEVLDQSFVSVLGSGQTLEQRPVELGPRIGGERVVRAGLLPGERIVVDGAQRVPPGAPVTPVPAETADAPPGR